MYSNPDNSGIPKPSRPLLFSPPHSLSSITLSSLSPLSVTSFSSPLVSVSTTLFSFSSPPVSVSTTLSSFSSTPVSVSTTLTSFSSPSVSVSSVTSPFSPPCSNAYTSQVLPSLPSDSCFVIRFLFCVFPYVWPLSVLIYSNFVIFLSVTCAFLGKQMRTTRLMLPCLTLSPTHPRPHHTMSPLMLYPLLKFLFQIPVLCLLLTVISRHPVQPLCLPVAASLLCSPYKTWTKKLMLHCLAPVPNPSVC